jgi:hypothetical protein
MIRSLVSSDNPEALSGIAGVPAQLQQWITHYATSLPGTLDQLVARVIQQAADTGSPPLAVTGVNRMEIIRE